MFRITKLAFFLAITVAPLMAQQPPAKLNIQLGQTLHAVSPTLYGLMTEEINYSYDGGLYAEMVRNRTFQDQASVGWPTGISRIRAIRMRR